MKNMLKTGAATLLALAIASPAAAGCLNLFQHIPNGPFGGGSFQLDANTQITIKPTEFWGPPAAPTPNMGPVEMRNLARCFGGPTALQLNNARVAIYIEQRDPDAKLVNVNYCDFGGYENVSLNERTPPDFIGEIDTVPPQLPNANGQPENVEVRENPIQGGVEGKLVISAESDYIREVWVGGQEFFFHSICVN